MLKKLSLSLASLLAGFLVAELILRALGAAPDIAVIRKGRFQLSRNPRIGYEPVPSLLYDGEELSFYDYRGASNSLGFRDTEHPVVKAPGTYRVLVLGDSVAAGLRIDRAEDVFPAVLQRLLRERGLNVEVLNFGVSGYNTQQEVETFKDKGLRFGADLVLLSYVLNDRERVDGGIMAALLASERGRATLSDARVRPWLARSALYRFLAFRVLARDPEAPAGPADTVAPSFAELANLARQARARVLVVVFPRFVRWFSRYGSFQPEHDRVAELARRHRFQVLDLLNDFRLCKSRAPHEALAFDSFHPTIFGHRCAAAAMARDIAPLVPQR